MKTARAIKLAGDSAAALGRVFNPPLSRQAVQKWGEDVPPLREYQLRELRPAWFQSTSKKGRR